jgi:hypothetical protein
MEACDAGILVGDPSGQGRQGKAGLRVTSVLQGRKELSAQFFLQVYLISRMKFTAAKSHMK